MISKSHKAKFQPNYSKEAIAIIYQPSCNANIKVQSHLPLFKKFCRRYHLRSETASSIASVNAARGRGWLKNEFG